MSEMIWAVAATAVVVGAIGGMRRYRRIRLDRKAGRRPGPYRPDAAVWGVPDDAEGRR